MKTVRIANAGGYWGDDPEALYRQVTGGSVDYVTMDFLAEITMVILQRQRAQDPLRGYAYDFIGQLRRALPAIVERGVTVIVNAGGINPPGCADAVAAVCKEAGVNLPIAMVSGDDLMLRLDELRARGVTLDHMDGERRYDEIQGRVVAANAYLGARPIVEALRAGARIIVTGRTTDAALILAPMVHEFGWDWSDWNKLASGIIAGHIVECGAQATGGNLTDWQKVPSMLDVGYPIIEVEPGGDFVVTKHPGTGGMVTCETVTEQLLYEIGDPRAYLTPDVTADFTSISLQQDGPDRVLVRGGRGAPPPPDLKVSMVYLDGFKAVGTALISGPNAVAKGKRLAEMLWHRIGTSFADLRVDFVGYNGCWGDASPDVDPNEIVFRMAVADQDQGKVKRFANHFMGLALQGPPGLGVFGGRPEPQPRLGFWPALVPRFAVDAVVEVRSDSGTQRATVPLQPVETIAPNLDGGDGSGGDGACGEEQLFVGLRKVRLERIAYARSGDKGDHANIGVAARSDRAFEWLRRVLTPARVKGYYGSVIQGPVVRYELPNLRAFNFVLHNALGGGGTLSLRVDHQGKALAQGLLLMEVPVSDDVLASVQVG